MIESNPNPSNPSNPSNPKNQSKRAKALAFFARLDKNPLASQREAKALDSLRDCEALDIIDINKPVIKSAREALSTLRALENLSNDTEAKAQRLSALSLLNYCDKLLKKLSNLKRASQRLACFIMNNYEALREACEALEYCEALREACNVLSAQLEKSCDIYRESAEKALRSELSALKAYAQRELSEAQLDTKCANSTLSSLRESVKALDDFVLKHKSAFVKTSPKVFYGAEDYAVMQCRQKLGKDYLSIHDENHVFLGSYSISAALLESITFLGAQRFISPDKALDTKRAACESAKARSEALQALNSGKRAALRSARGNNGKSARKRAQRLIKAL